MKEFKVILGQSNKDTHILVDNQQVGWVQSIKIQVDVDLPSPQIEIVFPDLRQINQVAAQKIQQQVELLKDLPQVKATLQKIEFPKT